MSRTGSHVQFGGEVCGHGKGKAVPKNAADGATTGSGKSHHHTCPSDFTGWCKLPLPHA